MDCQHCGKRFSDTSEFETHCSWHTERQIELQRGPRIHNPDEQPHSASTDQSAKSQSGISAQCPPESTTTVESPTSLSTSHSPTDPHVVVGELNVLNGDFNFGTFSAVPATDSQDLPLINTFADVVVRFPSFDIENSADSSTVERDYKCADCQAVFSTQKDFDVHSRSRFCPGSAAVAYALYRDLRRPGGYRIDKKYLPFDGHQICFKCKKCHLRFSDRLLKQAHERSHPRLHTECLHCQRSFNTAIELESHYQWHDDMEYRHHRDKCLKKLPGLKLESKYLKKRQSKIGVADFGRKPVLIGDERLVAIPEQHGEEGLEQVNNVEPEKELVAISFISPEDLERIHAPNGFLRHVEPNYLHTQKDSRAHHTADALHALEGKPSRGQESTINSTSSTDNGGPVGLSPKLEEQNEVTTRQPNSLRKRSSIRDLFRRTQSEPQLRSDVKRYSSFRTPFRRESVANSLNREGRLTLSTILQRVSTAANKGDTKAVRKECDRLMAIARPLGSDSDSSTIPVQAFCYPDGHLVQDTAGNARYISSKTVNEITSSLRNTPVAQWAKTKVSVLSTRAYLSTNSKDYADAVWCYQKVLDLLQEQPMLFPDVIWHAAILSNLARLSAKLKVPDDVERYYLRALAISYKRYGRNDLNNVNFLTALAAAYEKNAQVTTAGEAYKRCLFARMEISGPDKHETLMAMQELAAMYCQLGNWTAAKLLYEKCLRGFETQLGLDHKLTLLVVDRLSKVYFQLQAREEALALYLRAFPHLQAVREIGEGLPRAWVSRYIQHSQDFDLPREVLAILQSYRRKPNEKNLWVLQGLARAYMLAGLLPDALETFEFVYNARRTLQGEYDPATLDALHGHCLALECMDNIDAAHLAYANLIQMALRSLNYKDGNSRASNVRARLEALQERKEVLADEKEAWGLKKLGPCETCRYQTTLLCQKCHISRFCCEACRDLASRSHSAACHPSVTLCQSKSVTAVEGIPQWTEEEVILHLSHQKIRKGMKATIHRISNSFTFSYDPQNLTTFRVKFNSLVDTYLSFDRDADVRVAIINPSVSTGQSRYTATNPVSRGDASEVPSLRGSWETEEPVPDFRWSTPQEIQTLLLPKGKELYLLVAPGEKLFKETVEKRQKLRRGDSEGLEKLSVPDESLIGYSQGLVLQAVERKTLCYLVEVES